ncbi:MAG: metallophosphoesterase, partial [Chitinophagaceae bacterium]|nr:metallophosphoesterase [Chitinophagaceae bacterium]
FSGKAEEYEEAKLFVDSICGACKLSNEQVFVIPGNHDVERSKIKPIYKGWYNFQKEEELVAVLSDDESLQKIRATTAAYDDFVKGYGNGKFPAGKYGEYLARMPLGAKGLEFCIAGLNSALFCGYDGDDQKHLALGLGQVSKCYEMINTDTDVILTCIHHPFECFHDCERPSVETVKRNSDIILSGHVHEPDNNFSRDGNTGETIHIMAGAGYEKRNSFNSFNIIEINPDDLSGNVVFYKYLPRNHSWIQNKDINPDNNGVFDFKIKKPWYEADEATPAPRPVSKQTAKKKKTGGDAKEEETIDTIPKPPAFYAKPKYLGTHRFTGRQTELDTLNDWASAANTYNVLLFEAMGGMGKSMLTWEWVTRHATHIRKDWKGIFWYSFYEKGAVMADFCQHALAYMTKKPLKKFRKMKTLVLGDLLLDELNRAPWLLVLDGLERVLEEYNNIRFAEDRTDLQMNSEEKSEKHPCSCIRDEDDDLLVRLSAAAPSKILISSRLAPVKFFNVSNQVIPGIQRYALPGLRPADAASLFRQCGIKGDGQAMQEYLVANCDCHPLTVGVLAGIINDFMPDKGNFDKWAASPDGAGKLNLAKYDIKGKQNHILKVALAALSDKDRQLLSILSLIYEAVDYNTISAFNPHLPPEPEEVPKPEMPEKDWMWKFMAEEQKVSEKKEYPQKLKKYKQYLIQSAQWKGSDEYKAAPEKLKQSVKNLELRGLLQYDNQSLRYDLHPVVRAVAGGALSSNETTILGQQVVDFFSARPHNPYENATTIEELSDGLHIMRTYLRMGQLKNAISVYRDNLGQALLFNVEDHRMSLSILQSFFPEGWNILPLLNDVEVSYLLSSAAISLHFLKEGEKALHLYELLLDITFKGNNIITTTSDIRAFAYLLHAKKRYADSFRIRSYALNLSEFSDPQSLFLSRLHIFSSYVTHGLWEQANNMWNLLNPMGRNWQRNNYRKGDAESHYAHLQLYRNRITIKEIENLRRLATAGTNRIVLRRIFWLEGQFHMLEKEWSNAVNSFGEAVRMAREVGIIDNDSYCWLLLSKYKSLKMDKLVAIEEANQMTKNPKSSFRPLAMLYQALGKREEAIQYAIKAYEKAWASGEPYVDRYELTQTTKLLEELGAEIPVLPPYSPDNDMYFDWEEDVKALVEKVRKENEEKKRKKAKTIGKK